MVTAAIGAGLALASAIYGGIQSASANNKARKLIAQQRYDNKRWYDTKMAEDYTMRTDAQAAINKARQNLEEWNKRIRKTGVVSGATDEAVAMQKEAANKTISDVYTDLGSQASASKDQAEAQYRAQDSALNQQQVQSHQQQAAQTAQAASQAVNAGINMVGNSLAMQSGGTGVPQGATTDRNLGQLPNAAVNTDLTSAGSAQLGITSEGLPVPKPIGDPTLRKMNA